MSAESLDAGGKRDLAIRILCRETSSPDELPLKVTLEWCEPFHQWFRDKSLQLDPAKCEGMVVVEEVVVNKGVVDFSSLHKTAHCFGIEWQEVQY